MTSHVYFKVIASGAQSYPQCHGNRTSSYLKSSVDPVPTTTGTQRFQMSPARRAYSKSSVFSLRIRLLSVDGKCRHIYAFLHLPGLVWTHPKCAASLYVQCFEKALRKCGNI